MPQHRNIYTPNGRYLGRKKDSPDTRDCRFRHVHRHAMGTPLPQSVDLRAKLPPVFDQGNLGSCGPNAGDGLMCFLFPEMAKGGFSRLMIYYNVRVMEGSVRSDDGVETRDVLKTLMNTGAAPESDWPYNIRAFRNKPSAKAYSDAAKYKLIGYSRLVAEQEYLACLASGYPFLLGFECFESIDSDQLANTGVMPTPDEHEQVVGGHDVLPVGYDLNFKQNADFKKSGVDPARVSNEALLIRNSWGSSWGLNGHFWMPMPYAINPSTGGDAWTGRRAEPDDPPPATS